MSQLHTGEPQAPRVFGEHLPQTAALFDDLSSRGLLHGDVMTLANEYASAAHGEDADRQRRARQMLDKAIERAEAEQEITSPIGAKKLRDQLPAERISHPAVREAVEAAVEARDRAAGYRRELGGLEKQRPKALQADTEALAAAQRTGKRDPGQPNVDALDEKVRDAKRNAEAAALNDTAALEDLNRALVEHGEEWKQQAADALLALRARWTGVLDELAAVHVDLSDVLGVFWFTHGRRPRPSSMSDAVPVPRTDSGHLSVASLLAALRDVGRSPLNEWATADAPDFDAVERGRAVYFENPANPTDEEF